MLAWHFLPEDGRLSRYYGSKPTKVRAGQTLRRDPAKLALCEYGLHASIRLRDALTYAPGPVVCRVRVGGTIIHGGDKLVASRRTVIAMADASATVRLYACWCVRQIWHLLDDERSRNAVEVAERYARGDATEEELDAARAAARDVAWAAAGDAAGAAAGAAARAAAWDVAWAAAGAAAKDAARAAARDAARDAAWAAARAAAWDVAWDAAKDAQEKQLEKMLRELLKLEEGE